MPIANHAALRLREAVQEYLSSIAGDTGTRRRGGVNRRVNDEDRETYEIAQNLLGRLDSSSNVPAEKRDTPGARARDRAMGSSAAEGSTVTRGADGWPVLRGGAPGAATNGPAGAPAGGGEGGAQ